MMCFHERKTISSFQEEINHEFTEVMTNQISLVISSSDNFMNLEIRIYNFLRETEFVYLFLCYFRM